MVYVPNWFSVDLKTGMLCIHLEENECFAAWVSAKEYGFKPNVEGQDPKINLGCLLLQALLEHWPPTYANEYEYDDSVSPVNDANPAASASTGRHYNSFNERHHQTQTNGFSHRIGNQYFSVTSHTPIIISEANQTLLRFQAQDACGENEDMILQEIIPQWIIDIVITNTVPKYNKVGISTIVLSRMTESHRESMFNHHHQYRVLLFRYHSSCYHILILV